ncbi:MAG: gamma-glutamyltransferase, partial [Firmicutes bacterium]|nr:gamma-glutamyltransferase [Bacillota bacterium]
PGAGRIVSTVTILISAIIDHNMSLQEAIEAPRFYVRNTTENFEFEPRISPEILDTLGQMGYPVTERGEYDLYFGGAQGVLVDPVTGGLVGGADPRRDGAAIGY